MIFTTRKKKVSQVRQELQMPVTSIHVYTLCCSVSWRILLSHEARYDNTQNLIHSSHIRLIMFPFEILLLLVLVFLVLCLNSLIFHSNRLPCFALIS
jgi:L-asparagine transporter-like permease